MNDTERAEMEAAARAYVKRQFPFYNDEAVDWSGSDVRHHFIAGATWRASRADASAEGVPHGVLAEAATAVSMMRTYGHLLIDVAANLGGMLAEYDAAHRQQAAAMSAEEQVKSEP